MSKERKFSDGNIYQLTRLCQIKEGRYQFFRNNGNFILISINEPDDDSDILRYYIEENTYNFGDSENIHKIENIYDIKIYDLSMYKLKDFICEDSIDINYFIAYIKFIIAIIIHYCSIFT